MLPHSLDDSQCPGTTASRAVNHRLHRPRRRRDLRRPGHRVHHLLDHRRRDPHHLRPPDRHRHRRGRFHHRHRRRRYRVRLRCHDIGHSWPGCLSLLPHVRHQSQIGCGK